MRLGQLLATVAMLGEDSTGRSLWDIEDDELAAAVERFAGDLARRGAADPLPRPARVATQNRPSLPALMPPEKSTPGECQDRQGRHSASLILMGLTPPPVRTAAGTAAPVVRQQ